MISSFNGDELALMISFRNGSYELPDERRQARETHQHKSDQRLADLLSVDALHQATMETGGTLQCITCS
jgi:hypothetical protein